MSKRPDFIDYEVLDSLAGESGLAIAVVDESSREISVVNNNSICRSLNPTDEYSLACARFCGKALDNARRAGKIIGFECHAGLECRAVLIEHGPKSLVAIVGRSFSKSTNYRAASKRAISGDWSGFAPTKFFENILFTGSAEMLDTAAIKIQSLVAERTPDKGMTGEQQPQVSAGLKNSPERISALLERFNREIGLKPEISKPVVEQVSPPRPKRTERRTAEAQAWRSFFGSLLKTDYAKAADSILEFLADHYGFSALMWLEKKGNRLESTATFGELKSRKVHLGIAPDDRRLIEASQKGLPLELAERSKDPSATAMRTMNLFPIGVGEEISAAIAVLDPIEDEFILGQIARIGHSIAPQLEILRLRGALSAGDTLSSAVKRFSESLKRIDTDDLWLNLTQNAAEMLCAERASLLIFDAKSDSLEIKAIIGAKNEPVIGEEVGERVARIVFQKNASALVYDVKKTGLPPTPADRQYKTGSFLSCPISISNRTLGVMSFTDRAGGHPFNKRSLELFEAIGPQLAVAIDRASLKEKAGEFEQLSVTDALTGLLNRRYMEARLSEEIKRSNRHGFPMSFMMLDVDNFKSYNDEYGHPAGDEALKLVANVIRETLRGADVAARFGGEEFSILLPQTTRNEAAAIAERIRGNIEQAEFAHRRVTTSIGVASCSAELCLSADLVSAADKALYEAKRRGRNKVHAFKDMNAGGN